MRKMSLVLLLVLVAPRLMALSPADVDDRDARAQLAEMNGTLKEIVALMKEQAAMQRTDLLMRRVTLASSELGAAQERLRRLDQELAGIKSEQGEFEGILSRIQSETASSGDAIASRQTRMNEIKSRLAAIQDRFGAVTRDTISTQNEIETLRRELQDWRNALDKALAKP
jgi:chromosome segregation ATPase